MIIYSVTKFGTIEKQINNY